MGGEWLLRVAFCTDVTTGGLGKAGAVGGHALWGFVRGDVEFWGRVLVSGELLT